MKQLILLFFFLGTTYSFAQSSKDAETVLQLSKDKWQWMADKDVEKLDKLFDDKANNQNTFSNGHPKIILHTSWCHIAAAAAAAAVLQACSAKTMSPRRWLASLSASWPSTPRRASGTRSTSRRRLRR